jgi:hypothetical protein
MTITFCRNCILNCFAMADPLGDKPGIRVRPRGE